MKKNRPEERNMRIVKVNKDELEKLNSDAYQRETAEGVYQAVLRAFEEGY